MKKSTRIKNEIKEHGSKSSFAKIKKAKNPKQLARIIDAQHLAAKRKKK